MIKKSLWLALCQLLLLVSGCFAFKHGADIIGVLGGKQFNLRSVQDKDQIAQGLMGVKSLPDDFGMWFVFPETHYPVFWMKNTLVPLDILFFDYNYYLVDGYLNVPPCKIDPCPQYPSRVAAKYVLELSGGTAQRIGLTIGDRIKFAA